MGWARIISSVSMAIRLRKSMEVGWVCTSPREMVGNSRGSPPSCQTPRLTASATCRKWALQLLNSLQVWAIPITGRARSPSVKPMALVKARAVKPSGDPRRPKKRRLR